MAAIPVALGKLKRFSLSAGILVRAGGRPGRWVVVQFVSSISAEDGSEEARPGGGGGGGRAGGGCRKGVTVEVDNGRESRLVSLIRLYSSPPKTLFSLVTRIRFHRTTPLHPRPAFLRPPTKSLHPFHSRGDAVVSRNLKFIAGCRRRIGVSTCSTERERARIVSPCAGGEAGR